MKSENFNSGQKIVRQDLVRAESTKEDAIRERQADNFQAGVAADLLNGMAFEVGSTTTSVTVQTGIAYNSNGERIHIADASIVYDAAQTTATSSNAIGGLVVTPQSTGSKDIPLTSGVVNLLYIRYLTTTDTAIFSIHKVTKEKLFTKFDDGYDIEVVDAGAVDPTTIDITASAPPGGPWIFLGLVDFRVGGTIAASMFNLTLRPSYQINPNRVEAVTPKADRTDVTPPSEYGFETLVDIEQHIKAIGSATPTSNNPHGLSITDIGFTGKTVEQHEHFLHTSGIANGDRTANIGNSLNLKVDPRCPDQDELLIYGLTATQSLVVNGVTLDTNDLFGVTGTLLLSFTGFANGTYYIWVNTTIRAVEVGTTAPVPSETNKFLLWTVDFNTVKGVTNISLDHFITSPGGPCAGTSNFTNLLDGRLFGNIDSDNLNVDGQTNTFVMDHNVDLTGNLDVSGDETVGGNLDVGGTITGNVYTNIGNGLKSNLRVFSNTTTPNDQIDITADLMSIQGALVSGINVTVDITASGANGLDTGTANVTDTWYAVHLITDDTASSTASLLSTSDTGPTLPVGYTKFRRVGWTRWIGATRLTHFQGHDSWVFYIDPIVNNTAIGAGTQTYTFTQTIPPTSTFAEFMFEGTGSGGGGALRAKVTGSSQTLQRVLSTDAPSGVGVNASTACTLGTSTGQEIDIQRSNVSGPSVTMMAYYDPV